MADNYFMSYLSFSAFGEGMVRKNQYFLFWLIVVGGEWPHGKARALSAFQKFICGGSWLSLGKSPALQWEGCTSAIRRRYLIILTPGKGRKQGKWIRDDTSNA